MRADICDSDDLVAFEEFKEALRVLGANIKDECWAMGMSVYTIKIGDHELSVFTDAWSVDIEGPEALVKAVIAEFKRLLSDA